MKNQVRKLTSKYSTKTNYESHKDLIPTNVAQVVQYSKGSRPKPGSPLVWRVTALP